MPHAVRSRDLRHVVASAPGVLYRLAGRRPDPNVTDDVLADRIRSSLGPVEKRLDVPRVHVTVDHHVAVLHGEVASAHQARVIEHAVARVSGARGVESHLHVGFASRDTRPSAALTEPRPPSKTLNSLLEAAAEAGAQHAPSAVRAVIRGFADRIPESERTQLFAHLPADVTALARPPRRHRERPPRLRTLPQLVGAVTAEGGIEPERAEVITRVVLASLRQLVPEEARDVSAVLPPELRELWEGRLAR